MKSLPRPPIALEPEYARGAFTLSTWLTTVALSVPLAALSATELGQRWMGAHSGAVVGVTLVQASVWAVRNWIVGLDRALRPSWWPLHLACLTATSALTAVYAATAPDVASAAWLMLLGFGLLNGTIVRRTLLMLPVLIVPAVVLRLLFVPAATPASFAVAIGAGLAAFTIHFRLSGAVYAQRRLELGARGGDPTAPGAERRTAELRVAMRLHDELSGALLATRRALAHGSEREAAPTRARHWLARLESTLGAERPTALQVEPQLERFAASLGLPAPAWTGAPLDTLHGTDRDELVAIVTELLANSAAHGDRRTRSRPARIDAGRRWITLSGLDPIPDGASRGRGLRNIERRIHARDGLLDLRRGVARWKRFATAEEVLFGGVWQAAATAAAATVALAFVGTRTSTLIAAAVSVAYCSVFVRRFYLSAARARTARERQWAQRVTAACAEPLALARDALGADARDANAALAHGDTARASLAFGRLATTLRDVLWALEWTGTGELLRDDLTDLARERGAAGPGPISDAVARSARKRLALRRAITADACPLVEAPAHAALGPTRASAR